MFEILFYAVLVLGLITLLLTFFLIPLDNNVPINKDNEPEFTYDESGNVVDNSVNTVNINELPIVNNEPARIVAHANDINEKTPSSDKLNGANKDNN